jgi:regulator of replication initiation timing
LGFESVLTENEDLKHQLAGLLNQNEDLKDQLAVLKDIKRSKDAALDTAMMTKKADVERQEQLVQQLEALYATHEQVHKATFGRATKKAIVAR